MGKKVGKVAHLTGNGKRRIETILGDDGWFNHEPEEFEKLCEELMAHGISEDMAIANLARACWMGAEEYGG